ncbi:MAG TPA: proteasome-type protease [Gammaproteobacteria bacterium]|nr:proteasome-type protease [Gammaproteobacteria bacterium]
MTYCIGIRLDAGIVFLSDSRTNAGVDQVRTFRKTHRFERPGERIIVVQTAGNLALSQSVVSELRTAFRADAPGVTLWNAKTMFDAASVVGEAVRSVHARDAVTMQSFGVEFNLSLIVGGQIRGEQPRLFNVYNVGNFIESTDETPYFQLGEAKYGKPILDRVITADLSLHEAAKCALVSMDSTMKSNLSVGLPLDLVCYTTDSFRIDQHKLIDDQDAYFSSIRRSWGQQLRKVFDELPNPQWWSNG